MRRREAVLPGGLGGGRACREGSELGGQGHVGASEAAKSHRPAFWVFLPRWVGQSQCQQALPGLRGRSLS